MFRSLTGSRYDFFYPKQKASFLHLRKNKNFQVFVLNHVSIFLHCSSITSSILLNILRESSQPGYTLTLFGLENFKFPGITQLPKHPADMVMLPDDSMSIYQDFHKQWNAMMHQKENARTFIMLDLGSVWLQKIPLPTRPGHTEKVMLDIILSLNVSITIINISYKQARGMIWFVCAIICI